MKTCSACKQEKPLSEFYRSKNKPGGYAYLCKCCSDISNKKTRDKDPSKYFGFRNSYKQDIQEKVNQYKQDRGCQVCGENTHPSVLDLHHLDPSEKELDPASAKTSWSRFLGEAEKCIVLCANCHRKVHAGILNI